MGFTTSSGIFFVLSAFALLKYGTTSDLVPVYMWDTAESNSLVPGSGHVNKATFEEILLQIIEKSNPHIVVFAEENLSPEDFIGQTGKKTFNYLPQVKSSSKVSYFPLVENPIEVVKQLPAEKISEEPIGSVNPKTAFKDSRILIINLNDAKDDEDRIDMLRRHDAQVQKIYGELSKKHAKLLALFTGYHSSWIVPEEIKNHRLRREVEDDNGTRQFVEAENFMMYLRDSIVLFDKSNPDAASYYSILSATKESAGNQTLQYKITTTNSTELVMEFVVESGYWYLRSIDFDNKMFYPKNVYAPSRFSYHCVSKSATAEYNKTGESKEIYEIQFRGLQVEITDGNSTSFGDAYDCVGFTTTPIWSGLFVTFILVLILTLGLTMMMDIKTMDRFDDPKGKTIIVNASE